MNHPHRDAPHHPPPTCTDGQPIKQLLLALLVAVSMLLLAMTPPVHGQAHYHSAGSTVAAAHALAPRLAPSHAPLTGQLLLDLI